MIPQQKTIALSTIYEYKNDDIFDTDNCLLSENLLFPYVLLRDYWKEKRIEFHTADLLEWREVNTFIFMDIPEDSLITITSLVDFLKYILKAKWRKDFLIKSILRKKSVHRYLIINEPPTVCARSYNTRYHSYFDKIFTWNDDLVDNKQYIKFFIPQVQNRKISTVSFDTKKKITLIASNKFSTIQNELYSERRKAIEFYDNNDQFDLYGIGWEKENYKSYKGYVKEKIQTLSSYKFCICYENICGINGYITEKIFDCFFAGCIPIYWGAENIEEYIPADIYIDKRKFSTYEDLDVFLNTITEKEYLQYIKKIREYLLGDLFKKTFYVENYIRVLGGLIDV